MKTLPRTRHLGIEYVGPVLVVGLERVERVSGSTTRTAISVAGTR